MGDFNRTDGNPGHRDQRTETGSRADRADRTESGSAFNPSVHDIYWRESFKREPYYSQDYTYDDYAPAYRTGYESAGRYHGQNKRFEDIEPELQANYERSKGKSRLTWENAKEAVRAAWHRVERVLPGDADNDGR